MFLTVTSLTLHSPPADAGIWDFLKNLFSIFKSKGSSSSGGGGSYSGGGLADVSAGTSNPMGEDLDIKQYCPDGSENPEFAAQKYIIALADSSGSNCSTYKWRDRGTAPKGYVSGMALVFARKVCEEGSNSGSRSVASQSSQSSSKDALALYGKSGSLVNTYTLLIGLGMRESSGKHCEGRDQSASNTTAETAEAGMFQTSWNSRSASPEITELFNEYKSGKKECFKETFSKGVKCSSGNWSTYGRGSGAEFQELSKHCPAFAADVAAVNVRVLRKHYGPLNRGEAEFRNGCATMLTGVQDAVRQNPQLCDGLLKGEGRAPASTGEQASSCTAQNSTTVSPETTPAGDSTIAAPATIESTTDEGAAIAR